MQIVVTDSGNIWNHNNPYLEKYKETLAVLVVCLSGKKVTDKYRCFVSPYEATEKESVKFGVDDPMYKALASVGGKLNFKLHYHEDIVFLTDDNPRSLYPFHIVRQLNEYNHLHLVTISPWEFETNTKIRSHRKLLSDLSGLDSMLYYDSNRMLSDKSVLQNLPDLQDKIRGDLENLLPKCLQEIDNMEYKEKPYYFDFASESYIPLKDGFDGIDLYTKEKDETIDFMPRLSLSTLGMVIRSHYPEYGETIKEKIEQPKPRLDGKKVCNILREQRIRLAAANHIPFESEECPSIGPCAGTCAKCDRELSYLTERINLIPVNDRIYPTFNPEEEISL